MTPNLIARFLAATPVTKLPFHPETVISQSLSRTVAPVHRSLALLPAEAVASFIKTLDAIFRLGARRSHGRSLCRSLGAEIVTKTVVILEDDQFRQCLAEIDGRPSPRRVGLGLRFCDKSPTAPLNRFAVGMAVSRTTASVSMIYRLTR